MNKVQFEDELERLAKGFKYDMTAEKAQAYFVTYGHMDVAIWKETVRRALLAPRYPTPEYLHTICEHVSQEVRDKARHADDRACQNFMAGKTRIVSRTEVDQQYGQFRLLAMLQAMKSRNFSETMLNFLWGWLEVPTNQDYARRTGILDSILGEIDYYELKTAGQNPDHMPQPTANTNVEVEIEVVHTSMETERAI